MTRDGEVPLAYWRRIGPSYAFPVTDERNVEVLTPAEYAERYAGEPRIDSWDGSWNVIPSRAADVGIDAELGLGNTEEVTHLCDLMLISLAVHRHLGLKPPRLDSDEDWLKKSELDSHTEEQAEDLFVTIRHVYGAVAEAAARRQYVKS